MPAVDIPNSQDQAPIGELLPYYLSYITYELRLSKQSIQKYTDGMRWVMRILDNIPPQAIRAEHILVIKARMGERNVGPSRIAGLLFALKSFLRFCRLGVGLPTMDPKQIRVPRIPKREVLFLTPAEVQQFVSAIPIRKSPRAFDMRWLCFRALVEVLLGTGMRISEALSLKRSSIDWQTGEATIVGKGNKERTDFFSPRALNWIREYVNRRGDSKDALFLSTGEKLLTRETAVTWFVRYRKEAGIKKNVSAHMLRHTVATTLLFNGCPIGHIKEILGHENLMTTCNYYLGVDKRAAKEAHRRYLAYETNAGSTLGL